MPSASQARARHRGAWAVAETLVTVAVAVVLVFLVQAFVIKPYRIPSGSMIPTLKIGQRVLVSRFGTHPADGDIIVFHPPQGAEAEKCGNPAQGLDRSQPCGLSDSRESSITFVKRVVGIGGDRLRIVNGQVFRNGVLEKAPYAQPCPSSPICTFSRTIVVPAGEYYVMGDNRDASDDSRFWGPIPQAWIIGTAFFTYWPISRIGSL